MSAEFPTLAEVVAAHPEGQDWGIPNVECTECVEFTTESWAQPVAPTNPPLRGMVESFIAFEATAEPFTLSAIEPRWCPSHHTYHRGGCP